MEGKIIKKCVVFINIVSVVMFNVVQAEQKKDLNPYSRIHFLSRRAYQQDMKKYGFEVMSEKDQKKITTVLRDMKVEGYVPLKYLKKKLEKKGVVTTTGIWFNSNLSDSKEHNYTRYKLAKQWWDEHNWKNQWIGLAICSLVSGIKSFDLFRNLKNNFNLEKDGKKLLAHYGLTFSSIRLARASFFMKKNYEETDKNQKNILNHLAKNLKIDS